MLVMVVIMGQLLMGHSLLLLRFTTHARFMGFNGVQWAGVIIISRMSRLHDS